jgi:hypothetical protein
MTIDLAIETSSDKFDADSAAWSGQVAQLIASLKSEGVSLREERVATPGQRGGVAEVIMALGSAGAFTAAVTVIRAWLERDKSRKVHIKYRAQGSGDSDVSFDLSADRMSDEALKKLISKLQT